MNGKNPGQPPKTFRPPPRAWHLNSAMTRHTVLKCKGISNLFWIRTGIKQIILDWKHFEVTVKNFEL